LELCTNKHLPKVRQELFDSFGLTGSYCLPLNFSLNLAYNLTHNSFLELSIEKCKNNTTNAQCMSDEDIEIMYQQRKPYFLVRFPTAIANISNYENPIGESWYTL